VHTRPRTELADRGRNAAREPAAAERSDDRVDAVEILEDLEPDRAVPGHDRVVAERVYEKTFDTCALPRAKSLEPFGERHWHKPAAEALNRSALRLWCGVADHHAAGDAQLSRHVGDALRHGAGAGGPHGAGALVARRAQHAIRGAT